MEDIVVLIPAYKPNTEIMKKFIDELIVKFKNIVIVNDGSGDEFDSFFECFEKLNIKVLKHDVNMGKGKAIKTGFTYITENYLNITGTITADCDGQHTVEDIEKCAEALRNNKNSLVVGCRDFSEPQTPPRSKFGNNLTKMMFLLFVGIKISDTQSGLRGFSPDLMKKFLKVSGDRYEYETNMLIECKNDGIEIKEVPIQTVYINNNETSHFNPLKDSIIIYKLFIKYVMAAISSFVLDMLIFCFLLTFSFINNDYNILIYTIIARVISSIYNFITNSKLVFKNSNKSSIIKYIILAVVQMIVSGLGVSFVAKYLKINVPVIKLMVDTIIFIVNFIIQREWIFKKGEK